MEIWHYSVLGMLSVIAFVAVSIHERVKSIENKIDRLTFQYEKDDLTDKLNCIIDVSSDIEKKIDRL